MATILSRPQCVNTLRPRQNGRHFPDIFEWIFWNENVWISINISLKFVPRGPINNIPTLLQVMAWRRPGDKPLSKPMMVRLTTHICVTRPQWVKKWLCYSGHRVALVVHRAQKSVPDSAGEWPTFLPPPLESCSGTANVDGPNWTVTSLMTLTLNFKGQILKTLYQRNRIDMEQKGCESIVCWISYVTFSYDLDLRCSRSNFENLYYPWSGVANWHGTKGMWVNRKSNPLCDFELWPHPWPWTFKVKLWYSCIPRMGRLIEMEGKGCEPISCGTFNLILDLGLGFSRLYF